MLSLKSRTGRIGSSINTRAEMHGDESVTALHIPVSEIKLDAEELNALLQEPHAHNVLYETKAGSPAEPVLKTIKALRLADKIESANVTLELTNDTTLKLVNCKLSKIELALELGGLTSMSAQIQCVPKLDSTIARLIEKLGAEISIEIRVDGFGDQQKLALEAGPAMVDAERKPRSSMHKRIARGVTAKRRRPPRNGAHAAR